MTSGEADTASSVSYTGNTMTDLAIEVQGLRNAYGEVEAVRGIDPARGGVLFFLVKGWPSAQPANELRE